jgi:FHS family glucose/mannose:H+ symporter-like MFS transporter
MIDLNRLSNKTFVNLSCYWALFTFGMALTISSPILIELGKRIGTSTENIGSIFSLFYGGVIIGSFINGFIVNYFNRKTVIIFFYFILSISIFTFPFSKHLAYTAILIFIIGLSGGLIQAQTNSLILDVNKNREGLFISLATVAFGIGAIIGPVLPDFLMRNGIDWKYAYFLLALAGLINFVYFFFIDISFLKSIKLNRRFNFFSQIKLNSNKFLILLIISMFLYISIESSIVVWLPTFLRLNKDFSITSASQALSFFWISLTLGRLITGFLAKRRKDIYTIMILSLALSIISIIFGIHNNNNLTIMLSFIFLGLFLSSIWPLIITLGGLKYPSIRNIVISVLMMADGLGGLFSPWFIGKLFKRIDLYYAIRVDYIYMAILFVLLVQLFIYDRREIQYGK